MVLLMRFQNVVGEIDRTVQIAEEVMRAPAHRQWHRVVVKSRRRQDGMAIKALVEVEKSAVHGLQRIVCGSRFLIIRGRAAGGLQAERAYQGQVFQIHPTQHDDRPELPSGAAPSPNLLKASIRYGRRPVPKKHLRNAAKCGMIGEDFGLP
jgi:hypothetical protein